MRMAGTWLLIDLQVVVFGPGWAEGVVQSMLAVAGAHGKEEVHLGLMVGDRPVRLIFLSC